MNFRKLEERTITEARTILKGHDPYVLFSGGKDSLVSLHLCQRATIDMGSKLKAVYIDTTASIPDNLNYVKSICQSFQIDLEILRPDPGYFSLVEKWGFPTIQRRWCCYHLKIKPMKNYFLSQPSSRIVVDGLRADESQRRGQFPKIGFHRHFKCLCYHIIFNWTKKDVLRYISRHKLPLNPLYAKGFSRASECWCPVYKTVGQFLSLKKHYPEFFAELVMLESKLKSGGSALFKNGKRIYLRDL
jgi:phosphoadenosine phosphosulfate reductase